MFPLQAVIFDCDGVLFDSSRANIAYYNTLLETLGAPRLLPAQVRRVHMLSSPQLLHELFGNDPIRHAEATRLAASLDYQPFFRLMVPVGGLHATLRSLKRTYRLAMATNRGRTIPSLLRAFELENAFETVVGIVDVRRPKPHPDMLLECVRRLAVPEQAAVYVGDTTSDREAAAAARMRFIAVGDRCDHPLRVPHIGELGPLLRRLGARTPSARTSSA